MSNIDNLREILGNISIKDNELDCTEKNLKLNNELYLEIERKLRELCVLVNDWCSRDDDYISIVTLAIISIYSKLITLGKSADIGTSIRCLKKSDGFYITLWHFNHSRDRSDIKNSDYIINMLDSLLENCFNNDINVYTEQYVSNWEFEHSDMTTRMIEMEEGTFMVRVLYGDLLVSIEHGIYFNIKSRFED